MQPQAKPYKNNPQILAMTNLVSAYQNDDIVEFEKILRTNRYVHCIIIVSIYPLPWLCPSLFYYYYYYYNIYNYRQTIMEDQFIREHIEDLLKNIRTQVLVKLIRPYSRVRIAFIAQVCIAQVCPSS